MHDNSTRKDAINSGALSNVLGANASPVMGITNNAVTSFNNLGGFFSDQSNFSGLSGLEAGLSVLTLKGLSDAYEKLQAHGASISDPNWRGDKDDRKLTFGDFINGAKSKPFHVIGMMACVGLVIGTIVAFAFGMPLVALALIVVAVAIAKINSHYMDVPVHEYQHVKKELTDNINTLRDVVLEIDKHVNPEKNKNSLDFTPEQIKQLQAYNKEINNLRMEEREILNNKTDNIKSEINAMRMVNKRCNDIADGISKDLLKGESASKDSILDLLFSIKSKTGNIENQLQGLQPNNTRNI